MPDPAVPQSGVGHHPQKGPGPGLTAFFPAPHVWAPAEQYRHAFGKNTQLIGEVTAQCGQAVHVADVGTDPALPEWLWPECPDCAITIRRGNKWDIAWPSRRER